MLADVGLITDHDGPTPLGAAVTEALRDAALHPPLRALLEVAGTPATLQLLTTGELPGHRVTAYALDVLSRPVTRQGGLSTALQISDNDWVALQSRCVP